MNREYPERRELLLFVMDMLEEHPERVTFMRDIQSAYQEWRAKQGFGPSKLSVDSIGKQFPKGFPRGQYTLDGERGHGVKGYKLKEMA